MTDSPLNHAVFAVDFHLDGPRNAAAVAAGRSHLLGASIAVGSAPPAYIPRDGVGEQLAALGYRSRVVYDAPLAITIALRHNLPFSPVYDDLRAAFKLLEAAAPPPLQSAELLRAPTSSSTDSAELSLARAGAIQQLTPQLLQRIDAEGLDYVYHNIELPIAIPTAVMAAVGVHVDRGVLTQLLDDNIAIAEHAQNALQDVVGREFNPDNHQAVRHLLFTELALPRVGITRNGNATVDQATLQWLEPYHPAAGWLRRYHDAMPLVRALRALQNALDAQTIVRTDLDPLGTLTGRLSSSAPPLHGLDRRLRTSIEARPGHMFVEADYSQMELRVLAHLSHVRPHDDRFQHVWAL